MDGPVWCRNIETDVGAEEVKRFKLDESKFLKSEVGYHIILRDDGQFDGVVIWGNNFACVLKYQDNEVEL